MRKLIALVSILSVSILVDVALAANVSVGKPFPPFSGKDAVSGKDIALEDFKGKVVLVDFWATWCGPCVAELPNVKTVYEQFKDKGLVVISISLDSDKGKCKSFIDSRGMHWNHIVDGGGWKTRLAKKYGINSIPAMYLIDHQGVCIRGDLRGEALGTAVAAAIKKIPSGEPKPAKPAADDKSATRTSSPAKTPPPEPVKTIDPALVKQMQEQIGTSSSSLTTAGAMLRAVTQRVDVARDSIPAIASDLPSPKRAASTREAYLRLRSEISNLRCDLFVLGLLNERRITLPSDPFAGQPSGDVRAFFQAKGQLPVAEEALTEMKKAIGSESDGLALVQSRMTSLTSEVASARDGGPELQSKVGGACEEADGAAERWTSAWSDQLKQVHEVIPQLFAPTAQLNARCDEIDATIVALRAQLAKKGAEADMNKAREDFVGMCATLKELSQQAEARGITVTKPPANPFERRSVHDKMLPAEVEIQLKAAAGNVQQVRQSAAAMADESKSKADAFMPRVKSMQDELASGKLDAKATTALRDRFKALCSEILAAADA